MLPTHILGTFNVCHKIDNFWGYEGETKAGLFRYSFNNTPYLFFTEITHFCNFIKSLLPSSEKEIFQKNYVEPLLSRNYETTMKAKYTLNCEALDMKIEIYSDSESPVPTPMIMFVHGDRFEELYDKLFNKGTI